MLSSPFFILAKSTDYICSGGVGEGVGLGVVSVAGAVSVAGVGAGVGVGVAAGGFTGAGGRELGAVEDAAVFDGATSVPAACFTAARNFSADCGGCTEPVRMVLKSTWRPYSSPVASSSCLITAPLKLMPAKSPRARE